MKQRDVHIKYICFRVCAIYIIANDAMIANKKQRYKASVVEWIITVTSLLNIENGRLAVSFITLYIY